MLIVTVTLPELHLRPSDGHKIRGYFANWWGEKSNLLHNHEADGKPIYRYPLVQYKVLRNEPTILGLGEGAKLLVEMFLNLEELVIEDQIFPLANKNIRSKQVEVGLTKEAHVYQFLSPWMALNPENYHAWKDAEGEERKRIEEGTLKRNILAFLKAVGVWLEEELVVDLKLVPMSTKFKGQVMTAFKGSFSTNVLLPDLIGLGKSTSRGYGIIQKVS